MSDTSLPADIQRLLDADRELTPAEQAQLRQVAEDAWHDLLVELSHWTPQEPIA